MRTPKRITVSLLKMSKFKALSQYKDNIGNGTWFMLHHTAEKAITPEKMRCYADNFRDLCSRMDGCGCGGHCSEMLERLKPEDYFHFVDENGVPDGCLRHSVDCHNEVNRRLGKPEYAYDIVKPIWRSNEPPPPCTRGGHKSDNKVKGVEKSSARTSHKKNSHFKMVILDE